MNKEFTIPMDYNYKGNDNAYLHLTKNSFGNMELRTDYGDFVGVYSNWDMLCVAVDRLASGKYAE